MFLIFSGNEDPYWNFHRLDENSNTNDRFADIDHTFNNHRPWQNNHPYVKS